MEKGSIARGTKIGLTIVGTTIGAGFASGREIWEFFGSYGQGSQYGFLVSLFLFGISNLIILWISYQKGTNNYFELIEILLGRSLARIFDIMMMIYLTLLTVVMFAGSATTLNNWDIPFVGGVLICSLLVFIVIVKNVNGILTMNALIMPVLIGGLLILAGYYILHVPVSIQLQPKINMIWSSAIIYTSLNIIPLLGVLSTFGGEIRGKIEIMVAILVAVLGLGGVGIFLNQALLTAADSIHAYDIPIFALLRIWPNQLVLWMGILLWLAIFTTAVSGVYGVVHRIRESFPIPVWKAAFVMILIVAPLSGIGFKNLVAILYPLFGILNLFLLAVILLYPLRELR